MINWLNDNKIELYELIQTLDITSSIQGTDLLYNPPTFKDVVAPIEKETSITLQAALLFSGTIRCIKMKNNAVPSSW
jgi:hypothetical protein